MDKQSKKPSSIKTKVTTTSLQKSKENTSEKPKANVKKSDVKSGKDEKKIVASKSIKPKIISSDKKVSNSKKETTRIQKISEERKTERIHKTSNFVKDTPLNVTINSPVKSKPVINHLDSEENENGTRHHKRYLTRTLQPEEIQITHNSEIAKQNFDALQNISFKTSEPEKASTSFFVELNDLDYEDDFEDYESDFETNSSTKNTSASSEDIEDLSEIKNYKTDSQKHTSLTDEGFDSYSSSSFLKENKEIQKRKERITDLLNLITLDRVQYSLFTMNPIEYDTLITTFGKSNYVQGFCQTNDDNADKNEQTDSTENENKWTQNPLEFSRYDIVNNKDSKAKSVTDIKTLSSPLEVYQTQKNGCSRNTFRSIDFHLQNINLADLALFVKKAGDRILTHLENRKRNTNSRGLSMRFGKIEETYNLTNFENSLLENRPPKMLKMCEQSSNCFLTIHPEKRLGWELAKRLKFEELIKNRCLICIWHRDTINMQPYKILVTSGVVNSCVFLGELSGIVAVGLENGIMCCWDLSMNNSIHDIVHNYRNENSQLIENVIFKFNTFDTSEEILELQNKKTWPGSLIGISVKEDSITVTQILTLHEKGTITLWNIHKRKKAQSQNFQLNFNKIIQIHINAENYSDNLLCRGLFHVKNDNMTHLLLLYNDCNKILHYTENGQKGKPAVYKNDDNWVEMCTIEGSKNQWPYFLVGCNDLSIYLYSLKHASPLKTLNMTTSFVVNDRLLSYICWSRRSARLVLAITASGTIVTWDLMKSQTDPLFVDHLDQEDHALDARLLERDNAQRLILSYEKHVNFYLLDKSISSFDEEKSDVLNYFNQL